ncbi:MAG TPA: hypothetical protein VJA46_13045 [Acidimicrobiia bacterium]|nr:hypothetical protein [Acidimicrobiia bacterium]
MDITGIDDARFLTGVQRISELTGNGEAEAETLLSAYLHGAIDQALDQVAGEGPVPTSLTVLRADTFRWACAQANRIVSEREAEVLLRTTSSTARSVLATMRAMYEEALRELFLQRMRDDATVRPSGNVNEGLTWTLEFTESSLFEMALSEIRRLPIPRQLLNTMATRRKIEIPREVEDLDVLDALGIETPDTE